MTMDIVFLKCGNCANRKITDITLKKYCNVKNNFLLVFFPYDGCAGFYLLVPRCLFKEL